MVERRVSGIPLEHILGWAEFCGLRIAVEPGVFVPRRRTELLVRRAAALAPPRAVVVDLCCGSGAVGVALLAVAGADLDLHAADIDPVAVRCACRNVADIGGHVYQGDLFEPLPQTLRGGVDVLVANTPYVPTHEIDLMPTEARIHEFRNSLDGGTDGLEIQRRLVDDAPAWLAPAGHLLIETSKRQVDDLVEIMVRSGMTARVDRSEELGAIVVTGWHPR